MEEPPGEVFGLRYYLSMLRRNGWIVVVTTIVILVVALVPVLSREDVYEASVRLVVEPPSTGDALEEIIHGSTDIGTQMEVLTSPVIVGPVLEANGVEVDDESDVVSFAANRLEIDAVPGTSVIRVAVRDRDPVRAAALATALVDAYLAYLERDAADRIEEAMRDLAALEQRTQEQLASVQEQLENDASDRRESLEDERDQLYATLRFVAQRGAELQSSRAFMRRGEIIRPAVVPGQPTTPAPARTGVVAALLGALLGTGLALARGWFDGRVRSQEDVYPLRVMGRLQSYEPSQVERRLLRAMVETDLARVDGHLGGKIVQFAPVASGGPHRHVAYSVARSLSIGGRHVLLIGTGPDVASSGRDNDSPTLAELLTGAAPLGAVLRVGSVERPIVIEGGWRDGASVELLASDAMRELLLDLRDRVPYVVLSSPPLDGSANVIDVAPHVDATVLLVKEVGTRRSEVLHAADLIQRAGGRVSGVILISETGSAGGGRHRHDDEPSPPMEGLGERLASEAKVLGH